MLGRTSLRALSVLDVCSASGQKRALEKTHTQIREAEAAILHLIEREQVSTTEPQHNVEIQRLLQDREKLYQRLAWLKLDVGSIAQYQASGRLPSAKSDPVFVTRMAAYAHTIAPDNASVPDTYSVLMADGALPQPPQIVVFAEPNYPSGQGSTLFGAVPDWSKPIGSLSVAPGSAVTLFSEPGFWGSWHVITTDIPNLCSSSRLNLKPGQPVGSLMVYSLCDLPYSGGWIISLEPGGYLSARQSELLRVSYSAGPWEVFRLDVVEPIGQDRARILLSVDDVTPAREFVPERVRSGGVYLLHEERARGYRRFTLAALDGRPVVLDGMVLRIGSPDQEPVVMTRAIKVAKNESEVGMLQLGEAALYEQANYWGRVWIVHQTHSDFPIVSGLNDSISSIQLGPYTGVTLYDLAKLGNADILGLEALRLRLVREFVVESARMAKLFMPFYSASAGAWAEVQSRVKELASEIAAIKAELDEKSAALPNKQDITENVPDLGERPSGANITISLENAASSIRLWTLVPPDEVNIEYTCKLSQDYRLTPDGTTEEIFAYRTTLKFDQSVEEVLIGATDSTTIEIAGTAYQVDEDQSATVSLPMNKQLVIITEARDICTPALKIHTKAMPEDAQAVIFPDREVHQRLANLEEDELWEAEVREAGSTRPSLDEPGRKRLIDRSKFNKDQIANAQKAIKNAMSSIAYTEPGVDEVLATSRFVSARAARDAAWLLDFGTITGPILQAAPQPLSDGISVTAAREEPEVLRMRRLEYQALDEQQLGFVLRDTLAGSLQQGFWGWLRSAGEFLWNKIIVAPVKYVWDHAKEFGEEVIDGLKEFGMAAWQSLENFGDKLVAFLVNAAGEVAAFVLDTAEKVVAVVKTIVGKIVAFVDDVVDAIKKFIEYLAFLFNWGDILRTQQTLMAMFNEFMTQGQDWIEKNRPTISGKLKATGDDRKRLILPGQADLLHDMEGDTVRMPRAVQETIKVVGEVQEKVDWVMDKIFNLVPTPQFQLIAVSEADQATLRNIPLSRGNTLVNTVGSVADGIVDIFDDGLSPQQMLAGVLRLFEALMDMVIDGAIAFVDILLQIVELLLRVLSNAFSHEWYIPILSEIYELITGQKPSILSITTLILAIPVTVTFKLVKGKAPFVSGRPSIVLPDLSGTAPVYRTLHLAGKEALAMSIAETRLAATGERVLSSTAEEDYKDEAYASDVVSGLCDTITSLISAVLDAYPPDKEPQGGLKIAFGLLEFASLALGICSFVVNVPRSVFVDAFHEHEAKPDDLKLVYGIKLGIEAAVLLNDAVSVVRSALSVTGIPRRARRSGDGLSWSLGIALGFAHLASVGCICGMDNEMSAADKAAECLKSIPGPLAILRYKGLARNKYVWIGCATILVASDLGSVAGSIMSLT